MLKGKANLLIMPNLDAANISLNLVKSIAEGQTVGPIILGLNLPAQGETRIVGSAERRGVLNPDKGDKAQIYFRGNQSGSYACRIFTLDGELLFEDRKDNVSEGVFEWIPKDIASGIYFVTVEGPGINTRKKLAMIR